MAFYGTVYQYAAVQHKSLGATHIIYLDLTNGAAASSYLWNNTSPTSTVFSIGADWSVNKSGKSYVAYCFAPIDGYSSFGSYVGNGVVDGPFVYCNFRPAFVLIKNSSAGSNWVIYDNKRGATNNNQSNNNLNNKKLATNLSVVENETANLGDDSIGIDFLSNGFKIRTTGSNHNISANTYIYAAFAECPFKYASAR